MNNGIKIENKFNIEDGIYIPNIEACWLYKAFEENEDNNYIVNEKYLEKLLQGKLDWSFELIANDKLMNGIGIKYLPDGKQYTLDIINVKFKSKYSNKLEEKTTKELRDWCYENGFMFNGKKLTNWKRSSGKSRVGENLFLIDTIKQECLDWARMGLKFEGNVDIGSIRAYESLPLSSIHGGTININPNNILVIKDINDTFDCKMSKTWLDGKELKTETKILKENNSLFDGEGLLQDAKFKENEFLNDKGVALLRNRFMKCAGFRCDIQQFYIDYCEENRIDYDTFEIEDMYGNKILAKSVELITTPSSIKLAKYNDEVCKIDGYEGDGAWLKYWKDNCGNVFGVCKFDKPSHHCIRDKDGNILQYRNVLSYQFINTIPFNKEELKELVAPELEYVKKLKNDINFFLNEVAENKIDIEENLDDSCLEDEDDEIIEASKNITVDTAFIKMCDKNNDFKDTQVFKDYRRNYINSYIDRLREGKIHVNDADYCIVCGNPIEMLYSTVKGFVGGAIALKDNEVFCSRFNDGQSVVGFRSPHILVSNIGNQVNKENELIKKYMGYTDNIVYVNAINTPIQSCYSGMDYDIDSILLVGDKNVTVPCKRVNKEIYPVPYNGINNTGENNKELSAKNMSDVDHIICQNYIGSDINVSQQLNSKMNNLLYKEKLEGNEEKIQAIYKNISTCNAISNVEIDKAKKQFENLNVNSELAKIKKDFKVVDQNEVKAVKEILNDLYKKLDKSKADLKEYIREEKKPLNNKIRSLRKQLKNNNTEELKAQLDNKINERDNITNIELENEIIKNKKEIVKQREILSKLDTRIIKPLFFKYIGDNDTKKQRRKTNKKHKREIDNELLEKYAEENGIKFDDIDRNDKEIKELLKENEEVQKIWIDKIYKEMDTPMDWLEKEIDNIPNKKDRSDTLQVITLVKKNKHKADTVNVNYVVNNIKYTDIKINGYKSDENLNYKERKNKINNAKNKCIKDVSSINSTKADLYNILKICLNSIKKNGKVKERTGIESLTLEILFQVYGVKLIEMFK